MSTPYLGEIRIFSFSFPPKGWALCNGQLMAINQNQALFALLGTTYGGNGTTTFALPNLQAATPIYVGNGFQLGQLGGQSNHTLSIEEIPAHTHLLTASSAAADQSATTGTVWAKAPGAYDTTPGTAMSPAEISVTGGNQPHNNMPPYLVLNFSIALTGIFPTRN
ncbi:MAG TPA: tail fiber protein [Verrucomicrobiae bacterium]|nr:tail fiber protein [Verrucomicrobiae bacterium]